MSIAFNVEKVRVFELDNDRNSILCLTQLFYQPTLGFAFCSTEKSEFHIYEDRGLGLVQYIPPQKGWGKLWHNQKHVRK